MPLIAGIIAGIILAISLLVVIPVIILRRKKVNIVIPETDSSKVKENETVCKHTSETTSTLVDLLNLRSIEGKTVSSSVF